MTKHVPPPPGGADRAVAWDLGDPAPSRVLATGLRDLAQITVCPCALASVPVRQGRHLMLFKICSCDWLQKS